MSAVVSADRLKEIEARVEAYTRHALPFYFGHAAEDIPYLLALVQGMRERETQTTEALTRIARAHAPAAHLQEIARAVLASGPDTDSRT